MQTKAETVVATLPRMLEAAGLTNLSDLEAVVHDESDGELNWLAPDGDVVWLCEFSVATPRSGIGRRAMAELCMLADEHDCRIALNPWAQAHPGALLQHELERFYQSLGFGWRRDHVMVREPFAPTVVDVRHDVDYLPVPNRIELVFDTVQPRNDLTRTSFVMPVADDGSVVMATNRRRKVEVPGGHVEPGESQQQAAIREGDEETGTSVADLEVLGHLRMTSSGIVPDTWSYPHPLSYQSFFAGRVIAMRDYVENDECKAPTIVRDVAVLKPHVQLIARRARMLMERKAAA